MRNILEELLERAKDMPQAPERYVLFLEDAIFSLGDGWDVVFMKGEFVSVCEQYGYPAGAMITRAGVAFYVNELESNGAKIQIFVEEAKAP